MRHTFGMNVAALVLGAALGAFAVGSFVVHPKERVIEVMRTAFGVFFVVWMNAMLFYPTIGRPLICMAYVAGTNLWVKGCEVQSVIGLFALMTLDLAMMVDRADFWMNRVSVLASAWLLIVVFTHALVSFAKRKPTADDAFQMVAVVGFIALDAMGAPPDPFILVAAFVVGKGVDRGAALAPTIALAFFGVSAITLSVVSPLFLLPVIPLAVASAAMSAYSTPDVAELLVIAIVMLLLGVASASAHVLSGRGASTTLIAAIAVLVLLLAALGLVIVVNAQPRSRYRLR